MMEIDVNMIYAAVISALPCIVSVMGVVISIGKMLGQFKSLTKTCDHTETIRILQEQIVQEHQDNEELRKEIERLTEVISRVKQNKEC